MTEREQELLDALQERAKELRCLYEVMGILADEDTPSEVRLQRVVDAIPDGWQYPAITRGELTVSGGRWRSGEGPDTPWVQRAPVRVGGRTVGELAVSYLEERPEADEGPFLREERQLLDALAEQIGLHLGRARELDGGWRPIIDFLRRTDPRLVQRLTRKMVNHLRWKGAAGVEALLPPDPGEADSTPGENQPIAPELVHDVSLPVDEVFELAAACCDEREILSELEGWINQDRARFMALVVEDPASSLGEIADALERFQSLGVRESDLPATVRTSFRVALLRHFFTDEIAFVNRAKDLVRLEDFRRLARRLIHPSRSHGRLGGKSAGLYLARRIVESAPERKGVLADVTVPRTWYVASDGVLAFIRYNDLGDVYDRKYMPVERVRQQYPHVVQVFKTSPFPPELVNGLAAALDDLGDRPLIVRSSSLLEDRTGSAFSGKYKSLFLANRGPKRERLRALQDAVAEVYASIFAPDPIHYRAERNLLDVHEEMGIMIQEVVGTPAGRWFLPSFSGVAFSNNEFRWSPRIQREDGLVRLVPGLGTRAVDRLSDDYPVLLAPGRPGLRVNASTDEVVRYAPRMVDLIDLEANAFRTVPVKELLREAGDALPLVRKMVSIVDHDRLRRPGALVDLGREEAVVTFEGLVTDTPFMETMATLLRVLKERLERPVDIEFASDGERLHLLQCRPQSYGVLDAAAPIPRDVSEELVLFTAHRHVSNGRVPDLTHVVYVDPLGYAALEDARALHDVGRAVGRLNQTLPRRRFVLMGPGRWGSRGDIRLGVSVGYADVSNTAVLVEIARRQGDYLPDLSFGTHFFQDLVEARIRYLPLYPDEPDNRFRESFLRRARNRLAELAPEFAHLQDVVRVVDVPAETGGRVLRVLMNGEENEAMGLLVEPEDGPVPLREDAPSQ